jgi:hypothetical protein
MNKIQKENLGKFFIDVAKISIAVYVFTSLPEHPGRFAIGILVTLFFLIAGLEVMGGIANDRRNH